MLHHVSLTSTVEVAVPESQPEERKNYIISSVPSSSVSFMKNSTCDRKGHKQNLVHKQFVHRTSNFDQRTTYPPGSALII